MSYIAIILVCFSPASITCDLKANPNSFSSLDKCLSEVSQVANYYIQQGVYADGNCIEVKIGVPL